MEPEIGAVENEARSSVEVTRGVKGEYGWKMKIYAVNDDIEGLPARLKALDAALRKEFGA